MADNLCFNGSFVLLKVFEYFMSIITNIDSLKLNNFYKFKIFNSYKLFKFKIIEKNYKTQKIIKSQTQPCL